MEACSFKKMGVWNVIGLGAHCIVALLSLVVSAEHSTDAAWLPAVAVAVQLPGQAYLPPHMCTFTRS